MRTSVMEVGLVLALLGVGLFLATYAVDVICTDSPAPSTCNSPQLAPYHQALYYLVYPLIAIGLAVMAYAFLIPSSRAQTVASG